MPHLVGIDLAEAVSIAMLTQPESGSRGADVDCFSGHVGGLLRGVHPSPRLGRAAMLRDGGVQEGLLVPHAAPARGNNQGHTIARGVGRGVLHRRKKFGGKVADGGIVGGERGQPLAIRNVAVCRREQDPARAGFAGGGGWHRRGACDDSRSSWRGQWRQRFFEVDRTNVDNNHGLGLSIIRAIAVAHDATLTKNARPRVASRERSRPAHTVRNATVGGIRAARTAGIRPASMPIRIAEAMPPAHASTGITMAQLFELAYTAVAAAPASTPTTPPMTASRIDSPRNCVRIWPCVAPSARRRPISERRSRTEMIMMLATPTAPTISATTPSPWKRLLNAPAAAARAVRRSDGRLTATSFGASGLAVCASSDCTAAT